MSVEAEALSF